MEEATLWMLGGALAAPVERLPVYLDDNVTIPLSGATAVTLLEMIT